MKLIDTRMGAALAVGAVDIFARIQDVKQGVKPPFKNTSDIARTAIVVGSLLGNMLGRGKLTQVTEGAFLAGLPLLELSIYRATRAGGTLPFFIRNKQPRVQAVQNYQGAGFAASDGFIETAANGGIPIITTGVSVTTSGSGRLY